MSQMDKAQDSWIGNSTTKNPPSPHQRITYLKPLPDSVFAELRAIYLRSKTFVMKFNVPDLFVCDLLWPETQAEFDWIVREVVGFYGIPVTDIANLKYNEDDMADAIRDDVDNKSKWFSGRAGPYLPNSLNFTRFTADSITGKHHGEVECKINIPILNMGQACIRFIDTEERCWYPSPALLNIAYDHDVIGLERLKMLDINERAFLQIVLKRPYQFYSDTLPRPSGW